MKIASLYSHLNGYEFIQFHQKELWSEIEDAIASVDAEEYRTKISREKTMRGQKLYAPKELNKAIAEGFVDRGWKSKQARFWVTDEPDLIRKTLPLQPDEQKKIITKAGRPAYQSYNQTDFVKNRIAVEVQFGKYFSVAYDLFVKHLAFFVAGEIDVGVEIVPMKSLSESSDNRDGSRSRKMSTGVPWYEKELYNLIREGRGVPAVPLVMIGIEP